MKCPNQVDVYNRGPEKTGERGERLDQLNQEYKHSRNKSWPPGYKVCVGNIAPPNKSHIPPSLLQKIARKLKHKLSPLQRAASAVKQNGYSVPCTDYRSQF